jgi:PAS domain S-box-containing protein
MISVLYVDDEPGLLEIGKLFLEQNGQFSVDTITSAHAALTRLNTKKFDAIISDYQMPDMNGIEFLRRVRTSGNTIPFILFTGRGREEVVIQALNEGADFYLQKGGEPVSQFTELAHKIRQAVQKRMAETERKRAEEALIESEEKYRILIENAAECIIITQGEFLKFVNQKTIEISGYSNEELLSRPFLEFIHPEDRAIIATNYQRWMHGENLDAFIFRIVQENDDELIVEMRTVPILWGGAIATLNLIMDITERKKAENALMINREILAEAMDLAHLVNWEFDFQTGMFAFDDRFYALYGTTATREGGYFMPADVYFREFVHADDRDRIIEEIERVKGISDLHYVWQSEHRIIRRDGGIRHIIVRVQKITNDNGYVIKIRGVNQDITERKRAEEALRISKVCYRTIFETTENATIVIDNDATINFANSEFVRLSGYSKDEIEGKKKWKEFVVKDDLDRMLDQHRLRRIDRDSALKQYKFRFMTRSGETRVIYATIDIIPGTKKSVASLLDIAEHKEAEKTREPVKTESESAGNTVEETYDGQAVLSI